MKVSGSSYFTVGKNDIVIVIVVSTYGVKISLKLTAATDNCCGCFVVVYADEGPPVVYAAAGPPVVYAAAGPPTCVW